MKKCPCCGSKRVVVIEGYSFKCENCGYINIRGQEKLK